MDSSGISGACIDVAAAVIVLDGRVLLARRIGGYLDGLWEFPGGKMEGRESPQQAAEREISEELNLRIRAGKRLLVLEHDYPDKRIRLHFVHCTLLPITPLNTASNESDAAFTQLRSQMPSQPAPPLGAPLPMSRSGSVLMGFPGRNSAPLTRWPRGICLGRNFLTGKGKSLLQARSDRDEGVCCPCLRRNFSKRGGTRPPSPREVNSRGSSPAVGRFAPSGLPSLFPRLVRCYEFLSRRRRSLRNTPDRLVGFHTYNLKEKGKVS